MKSIFVIAGEMSGDLHGAKLIESLKELSPQLDICGVAGPKMRAAGATCLMPMEDFQVMGFVDVLWSLPRIWRQAQTIISTILNNNYDAVVFIDYPGLNLRLAHALRKKGYNGQLIHYICPTVWAWGKERIQQMAVTLDLLLVILPFEKKYFDNTSLNTKYIGHPLVGTLLSYDYNVNWADEVGIDSAKPIISIFPGSRPKEIARNLEVQLNAVKHFLSEDDSCASTIAISVAHPNLKSSIQKIVDLTDLRNIILVDRKFSYELMKASHMAIAKSGTVTLELALHQVPTVVTYKLTWVNWFLAKYIFHINLPYYSLPNIIMSTEVFPELIDKKIPIDKLTNVVGQLYRAGGKRESILNFCKEIKSQINIEQSSSLVAAKLILNNVRQKK
ncbi:MAG: lpxB [Chlamydiales bacterium]|jgi:lipid-A-disaccharide synthase|nr:lpxB [Chlamydiales bacterium]